MDEWDTWDLWDKWDLWGPRQPSIRLIRSLVPCVVYVDCARARHGLACVMRHGAAFPSRGMIIGAGMSCGPGLV